VDGNVVTSGDRAFGLFAQSAGGDAGAVDVDVDGTIMTSGAAAHGVLLQSIGGAGGLAVGALDAPAALTGGLSAGDGGAISLTLGGDIIANGDGSNGLVIQSLGGGGGWFEGDFAGSAGGAGSGGAIGVDVAGAIFAVTQDANAVFLQSLGRDGGGDILVRLGELVRGGSGFGAGMVLDGGASNRVQIFGSLSAVSGLALDATTGDDFIENNGLFVGNVDLGSGVNSFNNNQGSTFIAFDTIDLRDPAPANYINRALQPAPGLTTSAVLVEPAQSGAAAAASPAVTEVAPAATPISQAVVSQTPISQTPFTQAGTLIAADGAGYGADPIDVASSRPADGLVGTTSAQSEASGVSVLPAPAHLATAAAPAPNDQGVYVASFPGAATAKPGNGVVGSGAIAENLTATPVTATPEPVQGVLIAAAPEPSAQPVALPGADVSDAPSSDMASRPVAVEVFTLAPPPMAPGREAAPAAPAPASPAAAPILAAPAMAAAPATFTNAGDFVMGLSASRLPIDLLNGDVFANLDGVGDPTTNLLFGARVINTVELDGNFVQTSTGNMVFDVAFGPYGSDVVNVTGDTTVDGTGQVILTWLESDENITLFATAGTAVDNGLEIEDTMAVDFGIEANDLGIQLTVLTDFGQDFLNDNGQALGGHLDSAIRADGSAGIGRLGALLGNLQAGQEALYSAIFTELDPSGHLAPVQAQYDHAQTFARELFSCESPVRQVAGQCVWTRLEASASERAETFETFGVETDSLHFRGGFEQRMDNPLWTAAAAIGYDDMSGLRIDGARMRSSGQGLHAGLGFERTSPMSGLIVGAGVTTGWQWTDAVRRHNVFEPIVRDSSARSGYLTTELHVAQVFRAGRVFARPEVSGTITALHQAGFSESGTDGLGVEVLTETQMVAAISPEIALGAVLHEGADSAATLTVTLGADYQSRDRLALPMRFLGANPAADPAIIGTALDQESYRISTDLHLVGSDRIGLRFGYTAEFGDNVEDHRAGFDLRMKF
jgi:hypothetical protein